MSSVEYETQNERTNERIIYETLYLLFEKQKTIIEIDLLIFFSFFVFSYRNICMALAKCLSQRRCAGDMHIC